MLIPLLYVLTTAPNIFPRLYCTRCELKPISWHNHRNAEGGTSAGLTPCAMTRIGGDGFGVE